MGRLWLVALGIALIVSPVALGTAVGGERVERTVDLERVGTDPDGDRYAVVRYADLSPRAREAVRSAAGPGEVTVTEYSLAVLGAELPTVAVVPGGVEVGSQEWFVTLAEADFVRRGDGYYLVERGGRETTVEYFQHRYGWIAFLTGLLAGAACLYVGLRPGYRGI